LQQGRAAQVTVDTVPAHLQVPSAVADIAGLEPVGMERLLSDWHIEIGDDKLKGARGGVRRECVCVDETTSLTLLATCPALRRRPVLQTRHQNPLPESAFLRLGFPWGEQLLNYAGDLREPLA